MQTAKKGPKILEIQGENMNAMMVNTKLSAAQKLCITMVDTYLYSAL